MPYSSQRRVHWEDEHPAQGHHPRGRSSTATHRRHRSSSTTELPPLDLPRSRSRSHSRSRSRPRRNSAVYYDEPVPQPTREHTRLGAYPIPDLTSDIRNLGSNYTSPYGVPLIVPPPPPGPNHGIPPPPPPPPPHHLHQYAPIPSPNSSLTVTTTGTAAGVDLRAENDFLRNELNVMYNKINRLHRQNQLLYRQFNEWRAAAASTPSPLGSEEQSRKHHKLKSEVKRLREENHALRSSTRNSAEEEISRLRRIIREWEDAYNRLEEAFEEERGRSDRLRGHLHSIVSQQREQEELELLKEEQMRQTEEDIENLRKRISRYS